LGFFWILVFWFSETKNKKKKTPKNQKPKNILDTQKIVPNGKNDKINRIKKHMILKPSRNK